MKAPRREIVALALRLELVSIAWMLVEAVGSFGAGLVAGSTLLIAFGVDSVVELVSAGILYRRLKLEATGGDLERVERMERTAAKLGGILLFTLAGYVVAASIYKLVHQGAAEDSIVGIGIAIVAALGMPMLARAKLRAADRIDSRALRADAMETFTCGYLSWVLLAGLGANVLFHWWWVDGVAALILVPLLIREGLEALTGKCRCREANCSTET